ALAAWDPDFGPSLQFVLARAASPDVRPDYEPAFVRQALTDRAAELAASLARADGPTIERARVRIRQHDWSGAIALLEPPSRTAPASAPSDARVLLHRAQLERAMALADLAGASHDEDAADHGLKQLSQEPVDFNVAAASVARAALGWRQGLQGDARLW